MPQTHAVSLLVKAFTPIEPISNSPSCSVLRITR
jgi:hypothetical protein